MTIHARSLLSHARTRPADHRATLALLVLLVLASRADADTIDVSSFEYVDVVETNEGSVWVGVVTEQMPNLHYKLATADGGVRVIKASDVVMVRKDRNPSFRRTAVTLDLGAKGRAHDDELVLADTRGTAGAPRAASGLRIDPELAIVFPAGDLVDIGGSPLSYRASYAPGARIGYELVRGTLGLSAGGLVRYTSWRLPEEIAALGSHWTLETQAYARATLHAGWVAPYAGLSLGLDTNHARNDLSGITTTAIGFGMNLQSGITVAATRSAAFELGLDFHPGTDTIEAGVDASTSYYAFRLGASFRL